jgi:hypothetical protein
MFAPLDFEKQLLHLALLFLLFVISADHGWKITEPLLY